ncbi:enolase C-terminal domain-like protein [Paenibacillus sp. J2TS4]|uniref:enolase C-terminal domain-like protein n=1 Tax=Paenibacillus sp. J2TS4 TaxID=2807194 RepID=UPI001AFFB5C0|nr:enolase C-terminal domain-like protein [Paenibacillus sp. J2TS4]GIP33781.1 hypothetical protein J2TS4_29910 [Paenibacillus sp. J2TS4]
MNISQFKHAVVREKLIAPFGFKGGYIDELWQSIVLLKDEERGTGIGLGVQSVLWSDADVFDRFGGDKGNETMAEMTYRGLQAASGEYAEPFELLDEVLQPVYDYGKELTYPDLRLTFALNSLVPVDFAAWQLYARQKGTPSFDELVPEDFRSVLSYKHAALASTPLIPYGMSDEDITALLDEGYFVLKIKLGADPGQNGDRSQMLEWDIKRLEAVHRLARDRTTENTENGRIAYYLDANGRYDSKDRLLSLLDHADRIGALNQILLLEEPFPESDETDVSDLPVRIAADESVHNEKDAEARIGLGYGAIALKPVAKTLSVSLKTAKIAHESKIPCFCADLTASPWMVDWNKNVAARLEPVPGLKVGLLESNGHQNYQRWEKMRELHPYGHADWTVADKGIFRLNDSFYSLNGGIFAQSEGYEKLVEQK